MSFGQLVIGPPGAGKTTYCNGMQQYLTLLGRKVAVINLDPANDVLPYECAVDVRDLVSLEEVQEETGLGPNGGVLKPASRPSTRSMNAGRALVPPAQAGQQLCGDGTAYLACCEVTHGIPTCLC